MRRLATGDLPLEPVFLPESRFACQGSGGCCRNYVFGPLTDADVARVEAVDLSFALPGGPFYETRRRPDGRAERFLRTTADGRCVFLESGNRCGLHRRHGGAVKPGFCQLFPLVVWPTLAGLKISDSGECASFPASASAGPSLLSQFAHLQELLPTNLPLQHPLVHLAPGAPCDFSVFAPVQDALVALVRPGPAAGTLRALGALLAAAIAAVRACPVAPDEPATTLAPVLAAAPESWFQGGAIPRDRDAAGRAAIATLARELGEVFAAAGGQPGGAPPFTTEILAAFARIGASAEGRGPPLPAEPDGAPDFWALSFRQHLFGQRALVDGRPQAALLRLCFDWLVTRAGAATRTYSFGHLLARRRLDMPWPPVHRVLLRREALLPAVLDGLAAV
jgi:Fe-S-cluster containining protein